MSGYGYTRVHDKGFVAFREELSSGAWRDVSIKKYDEGDGTIAKALLADAPAAVVWKLRATWGIRSLAAATGPDALTERDEEWDSAQRAFNLAVGSAEEHRSAAVRKAAAHVRAQLLSGAGVAQTRLPYDQEVDFGKNQLELAARPELAADVERIGAGDHLKRIREATDALADAIGRNAGKPRSPARSLRLREAMTACSAAFNAIHDEIAWAIEHTTDRDALDRLEALRAPFDALLARYPATGAPAAAEDDGTTVPIGAPEKPPQNGADAKPAPA